MKKISNPLLLLSCIGALIACVYVPLYNHVGELIENGRIRHGTGGGLSLTIHFVELQWYAFLVPFAGLVLGLRFRKMQNEFGAFWVSAFMVAFAIAWAFLAILVWQVQSIPHWD